MIFRIGVVVYTSVVRKRKRTLRRAASLRRRRDTRGSPTMASAETIVGRTGRIRRGLSRLLASLLVLLPVASAQYPSAPQITKDGTAVLIEEYASLPLSSITTRYLSSSDRLSWSAGSRELLALGARERSQVVIPFLRERLERHSLHLGQEHQAVHSVHQFRRSLSEDTQTIPAMQVALFLGV